MYTILNIISNHYSSPHTDLGVGVQTLQTIPSTSVSKAHIYHCSPQQPILYEFSFHNETMLPSMEIDF